MAQTPTTEPASIQAGDTICWQRTLPDYPASDGWQLSYLLISTAAHIVVPATAAHDAHDAHDITISAAASAAYPPGIYTWQASVARTGERYTVDKGAVTIKPNWATAGNADARSPAARALADLRAALLKWLSTSGQVQEYEIAGRRMRFATAFEIRERIRMAESEVRREARELSGQSAARRVVVRY